MRWQIVGLIVGSLLLAALNRPAWAGDIALTDEDCIKILERWAADPDSVPANLVEPCRHQVDTIGGPEASAPPESQQRDPCAELEAEKRVDCWGRWEPRYRESYRPVVLAALPLELRPEDASQLTPTPLPPEPPLGGCVPGTPCGFATVVAGVTGSAPGDDTIATIFQLAPDGSAFTVAPGLEGEVDSVTGMVPSSIFIDGVENVRSVGNSGDLGSRFLARVFRDEADGPIRSAADFWQNGNVATGEASSGFFAWGFTTTQADLDTLNGGAGIDVSFAGPMSVDNRTNSEITVHFGVAPTWDGTWTNPNYAFDAGGRVTGVDLVSDPAAFSPNVLPGSFVQGVLIGPIGDQRIAHVFDVTLSGIGNIKDVGLLHQVDSVPR
jgi:hypothetical protein